MSLFLPCPLITILVSVRRTRVFAKDWLNQSGLAICDGCGKVRKHFILPHHVTK
jgi:hypothetical protein